MHVLNGRCPAQQWVVQKAPNHVAVAPEQRGRTVEQGIRVPCLSILLGLKKVKAAKAKLPTYRLVGRHVCSQTASVPLLIGKRVKSLRP